MLRLAFAISFSLGSYCECFVRAVPAESCEYLAVQCGAEGVCALTLIHPFVGSGAQGASETSENKYADVQKVDSCLQQDQFPWELCASAIIVSHVNVHVWL